MTYYILPQIEYNIKDSNLKLTILQNDSQVCQKEYSLKKYLSKIKGLIDKHIDDWDVIKKYTNPYEFIHTIIPKYKVSICKYKPISRAFFKLIEIYNTFNLLNMKHMICIRKAYVLNMDMQINYIVHSTFYFSFNIFYRCAIIITKYFSVF